MEKEKIEVKKPEWCPSFVNVVLDFYVIKLPALEETMNIKHLRSKYYSQSVKARKNRRREVRDAINHSYLHPAIIYDDNGNIVKQSDYKDTEELINSVSKIIYYYRKDWWTVIKEAGHEKDFVWTTVKEGHGGWNWEETRITHIPLNIYIQS